LEGPSGNEYHPLRAVSAHALLENVGKGCVDLFQLGLVCGLLLRGDDVVVQCQEPLELFGVSLVLRTDSRHLLAAALFGLVHALPGLLAFAREVPIGVVARIRGQLCPSGCLREGREVALVGASRLLEKLEERHARVRKPSRPRGQGPQLADFGDYGNGAKAFAETSRGHSASACGHERMQTELKYGTAVCIRGFPRCARFDVARASQPTNLATEIALRADVPNHGAGADLGATYRVEPVCAHHDRADVMRCAL